MARPLRHSTAQSPDPHHGARVAWAGGALPFLCLSFLVCQMGLQSPAMDGGSAAAVCQPRCPRGVSLFMHEIRFLTW